MYKMQSVMNEDIKFFIEISTFVLALVAAFVALIEFRSNNRIKRAEFLEKLIVEFHDSKIEVARALLDDFVYVAKHNRILSNVEQLEVSKTLATYLRHHKQEPITTIEEINVRESFDHLLDFFTKLSYYLKQQLITPAELSYFKYYLIKIKNKPEVIEYIKNYYYLDDFLLLIKAIR